jgi:uncharacterized protein YaiI (UPF0178 family)
MLLGGPPPLDNKDKQKFGNALDRWLQQQPKPSTNSTD